MPKGYVIFTETIHDPEGMAAYNKAAAPTSAAYGAEPLVVTRSHEVVEGEWPATQTVIMAFPSVEQARAWYHSPEYQAAAAMRQQVATTDVVIVEGFELPR